MLCTELLIFTPSASAPTGSRLTSISAVIRMDKKRFTLSLIVLSSCFISKRHYPCFRNDQSESAAKRCAASRKRFRKNGRVTPARPARSGASSSRRPRRSRANSIRRCSRRAGRPAYLRSRRKHPSTSRRPWRTATGGHSRCCQTRSGSRGGSSRPRHTGVRRSPLAAC